MKLFLSLVFFILAPLSALAAETGLPAQAGFPSQTIWVSNSSPAEGETVVVSAVVYNGESTDLRGTLAFFADDSRIGAREFELPEGESQVHSIEWKPAEGTYELTARIEGTSAQLSLGETPPLRITVRPPPQPTATEQTISQVVDVASEIASSSAPFVSKVSQTIFTNTEAFREAGIKILDNYLQRKPSRRGDVAGAATSTSGSAEGMGALATLTRTLAATLLFIMKNVALFYPILAFLVLGTLFLLARKVRRRS